MTTPLYRSRPGGFDILPASMPEAQPINDFIYASHGLSNSYLVVTSEGRVVINTGMGFERTLAVLQGASNVYETDVFRPIIARVEQLSGQEWGQEWGGGEEGMSPDECHDRKKEAA